MGSARFLVPIFLAGCAPDPGEHPIYRRTYNTDTNLTTHCYDWNQDGRPDNALLIRVADDDLDAIEPIYVREITFPQPPRSEAVEGRDE